MKVDDIHRKVRVGGDQGAGDLCVRCRELWPCETIVALKQEREELEGSIDHLRECADGSARRAEQWAAKCDRLIAERDDIRTQLAAADRLYLDLKSRHPVFTKGCHTCEAIAAYEAAGKGDITDRETGDAETAGPSGWPRAPLNDKISLRDVRPSAETRTTDLESRLAAADRLAEAANQFLDAHREHCIGSLGDVEDGFDDALADYQNTKREEP